MIAIGSPSTTGSCGSSTWALPQVLAWHYYRELIQDPLGGPTWPFYLGQVGPVRYMLWCVLVRYTTPEPIITKSHDSSRTLRNSPPILTTGRVLTIVRARGEKLLTSSRVRRGTANVR